MKKPRWILAAAIHRPLCLVPAAYYYASGMTMLALARVLRYCAAVLRYCAALIGPQQGSVSK